MNDKIVFPEFVGDNIKEGVRLRNIKLPKRVPCDEVIATQEPMP